MRTDLFRVALRYIEKGYSCEDLKWGDALYSATSEEKEEALQHYIDIKEQGTNWAYQQIRKHENNTRK